MGFAEIQAAFAAQQGQPAPVAVQAPAVAAAPQFTPSPFAPSPAAPVQAPAPQPAAFQFTPPAGASTGPAPGQPWPPINPPGERAPLAVGATGAPAAVAQDVVQNFTQPADPAKLGPAEAEPPKKRGRKPGAKNAGGMPGVVATAPDLAADGAAVATLPADGSTVEDIVSELFARGVSSVHLTFTKDGK